MGSLSNGRPASPSMPDQYILGLSAFYHDSAACLLKNGAIVAAASEERFTRKKADERFPRHAVDFCLRQAGITVADVTHVGFYDKPLLKFERILETYFAYAPRGYSSFRRAQRRRRLRLRSARSWSHRAPFR